MNLQIFICMQKAIICYLCYKSFIYTQIFESIVDSMLFVVHKSYFPQVCKCSVLQVYSDQIIFLHFISMQTGNMVFTITTL